MHKKIMKSKAKQYSETIISSSLRQWEVSLAYNLFYMASFSYGTAAQGCEEIQRPVVNAILPKKGVNRNTSMHMVSGTCKYGGLGLDHLAAVQGFTQIQYLIGSLRTHDTTGDLYQILPEYTQLECGTTIPILEAYFSRYEQIILTKNWFTECWISLSLCKSTVKISGL
jgi:hypothetical protein